MKSESYLTFCLGFQIYTKTGNSQFFKVLYQLKLCLIHINLIDYFPNILVLAGIPSENFVPLQSI
ncbi:hypothetical protein EAE93_01775 [Photorhabdus akhurstii]|nr:hypothetical protein [Photorhabdus akhurstii]